MATYELPIEAARLRLGVDGDRDELQKRITAEARSRQYGLRLSALAIAEAFKQTTPTRKIGTPSGIFKSSELVAEGWVLAERVVYQPGKKSGEGHYNANGVMLARDADIFIYGLDKIPNNEHRVERSKLDAWGDVYSTQLKEDSDQGWTACDRIARVDLKGNMREVDLQIGAVAAPLTLDDLLAGLVARSRIEIPAIDIPAIR